MGMRKMLVASFILAAAFATAPASADNTVVCTDTVPGACAGIESYDDGTYSYAFVVGDVETEENYVFAFAGSETAGDYRGTGACTENNLDGFSGTCAVLFQDSGGNEIYVYDTDTNTCYFITAEAIEAC